MNLYFNNICKSYGGKMVLENISGAINAGKKIGLVGRNGVGKTTLARILAGQETCDRGQIKLAPAEGKVFYLDQQPKYAEKDTVYATILWAVKSNDRVMEDIKAEAKVKKVLNMLGIEQKKWGQEANNLSGGEKTKLALCQLIVSYFDLLLLDEPTNHLDLKNCEWLEVFLADLAKPMIVISHDRFFLNQLVNEIWELTPCELKVYKGNYSAYKRQKEIEERNLFKEYDKQQTRIRQLKQVISERKNWYQSAHTAAGKNDFYRSKAKKHASILKAKKKELERIEKEKIPKPSKLPAPAFQLINKHVLGDKVPPYLVRAENINKSFASRVLFQDISFCIKRGEKIVLLGENGIGKTTLLKIIAGFEDDYSGKVSISSAVKSGYFAQEMDCLDYEATVLDEVLTVGAGIEEARLLLASLLFRGDEVFKKIDNLSMGEKGRVAFVKLILSGANLLILDEPTNYMDIESKEKMEEVLMDYKGSVLFVSHDRYFVRRLANKVWEIVDGRLHTYEGNYEYYLSKRRKENIIQENEHVNNQSGIGVQELAETITRLECELAFLGGKLDQTKDEKEKEKLQERFLRLARELNDFKCLRKR
ncbi:MAG: ribosomal protection-like ABC-F family protein [Dethiobacteria bacterium]|jgi:ATP-binding cassette subfamily F protein 3